MEQPGDDEKEIEVKVRIKPSGCEQYKMAVTACELYFIEEIERLTLNGERGRFPWFVRTKEAKLRWIVHCFNERHMGLSDRPTRNIVCLVCRGEITSRIIHKMKNVLCEKGYIGSEKDAELFELSRQINQTSFSWMFSTRYDDYVQKRDIMIESTEELRERTGGTCSPTCSEIYKQRNYKPSSLPENIVFDSQRIHDK
jgi:hypothetical protein